MWDTVAQGCPDTVLLKFNKSYGRNIYFFIQNWFSSAPYSISPCVVTFIPFSFSLAMVFPQLATKYHAAARTLPSHPGGIGRTIRKRKIIMDLDKNSLMIETNNII